MLRGPRCSPGGRKDGLRHFDRRRPGQPRAELSCVVRVENPITGALVDRQECALISISDKPPVHEYSTGFVVSLHDGIARGPLFTR